MVSKAWRKWVHRHPAPHEPTSTPNGHTPHSVFPACCAVRICSVWVPTLCARAVETAKRSAPRQEECAQTPCEPDRLVSRRGARLSRRRQAHCKHRRETEYHARNYERLGQTWGSAGLGSSNGSTGGRSHASGPERASFGRVLRNGRSGHGFGRTADPQAHRPRPTPPRSATDPVREEERAPAALVFSTEPIPRIPRQPRRPIEDPDDRCRCSKGASVAFA